MGTVIFLLFLVVVVVVFILYMKNRKAQMTLAMENVNIFKHGVSMCAEERFVKSYNCAQLRTAYARRITAKGILTITNQRVIFHTIGVNDDRDFIHDEVAIEDISGISVQSGLVSDSPINAIVPAWASLVAQANKKVFMLMIASKGGKDGVINIVPSNSRGTMIDMSSDMVPTPIVTEMANEIGAIVNDIQKLGDLGIEKWIQEVE
ncbi:MAG: hypothetical protein LBR68_06850 [Lachnoclostridium sp.]|jgi:hypothetical protein|nr:hypothetical protein [Lachnoclostridium sp.]